jgi:hypothetical protein
MPDIPENTVNSRGKGHASDKESASSNSRLLAHKLIPFLVYLAIWGVIYIGNRHYAQQVELKVNELQEELQTYRAQYLTMKAELMFKTKQSEVAQMVDTLNLHELTAPPEKLRVKPAENLKERKHEH